MQSSRWIEKKDDFYTYLKHFNTLTISWEDFIGGFIDQSDQRNLAEKANIRYKVKCRIQPTYVDWREK